MYTGNHILRHICRSRFGCKDGASPFATLLRDLSVAGKFTDIKIHSLDLQERAGCGTEEFI